MRDFLNSTLGAAGTVFAGITLNDSAEIASFAAGTLTAFYMLLCILEKFNIKK